MNLFSKILYIYLLFNILKNFGGPQLPLLEHSSIPCSEVRNLSLGEAIYKKICVCMKFKIVMYNPS